MKKRKLHTNLLLLFVLFFTMWSGSVKAQGIDVIVWMDNSGSIDATEYANMVATTHQIIDATLVCNPSQNKVAVVEYGMTFPGNVNRIYIETDFTNDATAAKNFQRRGTSTSPTPADEVGSMDDAHAALGLIGDALDGIPNPNIVSPQKTLTTTPGNTLVVFFFTDAMRNSSLSAVVNMTGSGSVFQNYNDFKINRNAYFVVLKGVGDSGINDANPSCAAIASVGGNFTNHFEIETNPGDPQGSKATPRAYYYTPNFSISSADLADLVDDIGTACSGGDPAPALGATNIYPVPATVGDMITELNMLAHNKPGG